MILLKALLLTVLSTMIRTQPIYRLSNGLYLSTYLDGAPQLKICNSTERNCSNPDQWLLINVLNVTKAKIQNLWRYSSLNRLCFIYSGTIDTSTYSRGIEQQRHLIQESLKILTFYYDNFTTEEDNDRMFTILKENQYNCNIWFATSFYQSSIQYLARFYPQHHLIVIGSSLKVNDENVYGLDAEYERGIFMAGYTAGKFYLQEKIKPENHVTKQTCFIKAYDNTKNLLLINYYRLGFFEATLEWPDITTYTSNNFNDIRKDYEAALTCLNKWPNATFFYATTDKYIVQKLAIENKRYAIGHDRELRYVLGERVLYSAQKDWITSMAKLLGPFLNRTEFTPRVNSVTDISILLQEENINKIQNMGWSIYSDLDFDYKYLFSDTIIGSNNVYSEDSVPIANETTYWSIKWYKPVSIIYIIVAILFLTYSISITVYIIKYQNIDKVNLRGPMLLQVMNIGSMLMILSKLMIMIDINYITCNLSWWLLICGTCLYILPLISKNWRIYYYFKASISARVISISDIKLLKFYSLNLIFLLIILFIGVIITPFDRTETVYPTPYTILDLLDMNKYDILVQCSTRAVPYIYIPILIYFIIWILIGSFVSSAINSINSNDGFKNSLGKKKQYLIDSGPISIMMIILFFFFWCYVITLYLEIDYNNHDVLFYLNTGVLYIGIIATHFYYFLRMLLDTNDNISRYKISNTSSENNSLK